MFLPKFDKEYCIETRRQLCSLCSESSHSSAEQFAATCLQQNGQDRTHVKCREGCDWKPERTLTTNTSPSLSPLPCKVQSFASVQCISVTTVITVLEKKMATARSKLPLLASTFWGADCCRTCRQHQ